MHQTTVRFSADLWDELETECFALGVSIAQYLREAAVARVAYSAARRGDMVYAMWGATGTHCLNDESDADRILAHWRGFIENNRIAAGMGISMAGGIWSQQAMRKEQEDALREARAISLEVGAAWLLVEATTAASAGASRSSCT